MTELPSVPAGAIQIGSDDADRPVRKKLRDLLSNNLPDIVDAISKNSPTDTFRVVMSEGHAHLFHQAANGTWSTALSEHGHIVENAHLIGAAPHMLAMAPNVIMFIAMQAVAAKLASIDAKLDVIGDMLISGQHGRLRGASNALATAARISLVEDRRRSMLHACATLEVEVLATAGLLKAQIGAMPEEKTGRFEGLFGTGFAKAKRAFEPVCETVMAIGHGTAALLDAYAALEEAEAGQFALGQIVDGVRQAGMVDAIRKARLLPASGGRAPEVGLVMLSKAVEYVGAYLLGPVEGPGLSVTMDLRAEEFGFD